MPAEFDKSFPVVDNIRSERWEDLIGESVLDHTTAPSISVLAYYEYQENGPSRG